MIRAFASAARALVSVVTLLVVVTAPGAAQDAAAPAAAAASSSLAPDLAGAWAGEYFIPQGQGPMSVTFTKADSGWGGRVEVTTPERTMKAAIDKATFDGTSLVFTSLLDGADVTFTARLEAGELVGKLVAVQNGNTVAEGDWSAHRVP